ncbi:hypothetical protein CPB86DRAFT_869933 [Serendipita vermifera]|nr:hypothetical protein CPB86DRAFT_869933 [Serendipita vermifera]
MRKRFEEISEIGGTDDFFWALKALERNNFDFKVTLDLLGRIRQLVAEPTDYSTILGIADHLKWKKNRLAVLIGGSTESSTRALALLRQNNVKEAIWLNGLAQFTQLKEKECKDALRSLVQLDYNFVVTHRFLDRVKSPMGCGGIHFSKTLSLLSTLEGGATLKEEIINIMNRLELYECSEERLSFIFSCIKYNSVLAKDLLGKLLAINGRLKNARRKGLWLLQYYVEFEDFLHLMNSLTTHWTTDEDRSIVLDFLETLNGDHKRVEQIVGELQEFENGSSQDRPAVPNRALAALARNKFLVERTLEQWPRLHAVNPRTTHWEFVLKLYAKCLFDIEYTVAFLKRLNDEHSGDPFWYDVFVVHALYRPDPLDTTPGIPNADQIISDFQANYKFDGKSFRILRIHPMGRRSWHLASVSQDYRKGLYGRTHTVPTP